MTTTNPEQARIDALRQYAGKNVQYLTGHDGNRWSRVYRAGAVRFHGNMRQVPVERYGSVWMGDYALDIYTGIPTNAFVNITNPDHVRVAPEAMLPMQPGPIQWVRNPETGAVGEVVAASTNPALVWIDWSDTDRDVVEIVNRDDVETIDFDDYWAVARQS